MTSMAVAVTSDVGRPQTTRGVAPAASVSATPSVPHRIEEPGWGRARASTNGLVPVCQDEPGVRRMRWERPDTNAITHLSVHYGCRVHCPI